MNTFFIDRLNAVHALIDVGDYDTPISIIQNIKTRIHDPELLKTLAAHDTSVEEAFLARYNNIGEANDPFMVYNAIAGLKRWRAQEYLTYYDKMIKEIDL